MDAAARGTSHHGPSASLDELPQEQIEKVRKVIADIVETETKYLANLTILVNEFVKPLRELADKGKLPKEQIARIFSNVEAIANFHQIFVDELRLKFAANPDDARAIAGVFVEFVDFLKMYTLYVNGYDRCCDTISLLKDNKVFQEFIRAARKKKECNGNNLMTFLIMPVQRIPVYEVLLERLLRSHEKKKAQDAPPNMAVANGAPKPRTHVRRKSVTIDNIQLALIRVKEVAEFVNENKRTAEDRSEVLEVSSRLSFPRGEEIVLVTPTRRLIREATLLKLSTLNFKKKRRVFLFNDLLLWATPAGRVRGHMDLARADLYADVPPSNPNTPDSSPALGKYAKNRKTPIGLSGPDPMPYTPMPRRAANNDNKNTDADPNANIDLAFELIHPERRIVFYCVDQRVKRKWVKSLALSIEESRAREMDIHLRRMSSSAQKAESKTRTDFGAFLAGTKRLSTFLKSAASAADIKTQKQHQEDSYFSTTQASPGPENSVSFQQVDEDHEKAPVVSRSANSSPVHASGGGGDSDGGYLTDEQAPSPPAPLIAKPQSLSVSKESHVQEMLNNDTDSAYDDNMTLRQLDLALTALGELTQDDVDSLLADYGQDDDQDADADQVPVVIRKVLEAVAMVLGIEPVETRSGKTDYWLPARKLIKQRHFLRLVQGFSLKGLTIQAWAMHDLRGYASNPLLNTAQVVELSFAAGVLWNWVQAIYSAQSGIHIEITPVVREQQGRNARGTRSTIRKCTGASSNNAASSSSSAAASAHRRAKSQRRRRKSFSSLSSADFSDRLAGNTSAIKKKTARALKNKAALYEALLGRTKPL